MIRLEFSIGLDYRIDDQSSAFIFNIHAAQTAHQEVVSESVEITPWQSPIVYTDPQTGSKFMRVQATTGALSVRYAATVEIDHHAESPDRIAECPVGELPSEVLQYIYPSRYCQSDRLHRLAAREFGHLAQGYSRVEAIQQWVRARTIFTSGSSNGSTSAVDTLVEQVGVCRDFAHLMIALVRAVNIPARFVTGIDYGADPAMGPTDFHAYVEVFLGDRWYLFDPTGVSPPMGLVRIGTGRDAADVAFATIFGQVWSSAPVIAIAAVCDPMAGLLQPHYGKQALSTAGLA